MPACCAGNAGRPAAVSWRDNLGRRQTRVHTARVDMGTGRPVPICAAATVILRGVLLGMGRRSYRCYNLARSWGVAPCRSLRRRFKASASQNAAMRARAMAADGIGINLGQPDCRRTTRGGGEGDGGGRRRQPTATASPSSRRPRKFSRENGLDYAADEVLARRAPRRRSPAPSWQRSPPATR